MVRLAKIILFSLIMASTTSMASELVGGEHESFESGTDKTVTKCDMYLNKFQASIVEKAAATQDNYEKAGKCHSPTSMFRMENESYCNKVRNESEKYLSDYRNLNREFTSGVVDEWIKRQNPHSKDLINNCVNRDQNGRVLLGTNSRILNLKESYHCRSVQRTWGLDFFTEKGRYLSPKNTVTGFGNQKKDALKKLIKLPVIKYFPSPIGWTESLGRKNDQKYLMESYNAVSEKVEDFRKKIVTLKQSNLYELYALDSAHKDFLKSLNKNEQKEALACKKNEEWVSKCISRKQSLKKVKECSTRFVVGTAEVLVAPVAFYNSGKEMSFNSDAHLAGAMTTKEYGHKQGEAVVKGMFSVFPGGAIVAGVTKKAGSMGLKAIKNGKEVIEKNSTKKELLKYNPAYKNRIFNASEKELLENGSLSNSERIKKAQKYFTDFGFKTKLNEEQKEAIIKAHKVALSKGFKGYTKNDLKEKKSILLEHFRPKEALMILRKGIAGGWGNPVTATPKSAWGRGIPAIKELADKGSASAQRVLAGHYRKDGNVKAAQALEGRAISGFKQQKKYDEALELSFKRDAEVGSSLSNGTTEIFENYVNSPQFKSDVRRGLGLTRGKVEKGDIQTYLYNRAHDIQIHMGTVTGKARKKAYELERRAIAEYVKRNKLDGNGWTNQFLN